MLPYDVILALIFIQQTSQRFRREWFKMLPGKLSYGVLDGDENRVPMFVWAVKEHFPTTPPHKLIIIVIKRP